jgi:hypothetical protein
MLMTVRPRLSESSSPSLSLGRPNLATGQPEPPSPPMDPSRERRESEAPGRRRARRRRLAARCDDDRRPPDAASKPAAACTGPDDTPGMRQVHKPDGLSSSVLRRPVVPRPTAVEPVVQALAPVPMAIELRHRDWLNDSDATLDAFGELGAAFVCVDAPAAAILTGSRTRCKSRPPPQCGERAASCWFEAGVTSRGSAGSWRPSGCRSRRWR